MFQSSIVTLRIPICVSDYLCVRVCVHSRSHFGPRCQLLCICIFLPSFQLHLHLHGVARYRLNRENFKVRLLFQRVCTHWVAAADIHSRGVPRRLNRRSVEFQKPPLHLMHYLECEQGCRHELPDLYADDQKQYVGCNL